MPNEMKKKQFGVLTPDRAVNLWLKPECFFFFFFFLISPLKGGAI